MYKVKIWIFNGQGDTPEEIIIESDRSLRGAKNRATRWINRNYFVSDIADLNPSFETSRRADWHLTLFSPWERH